MFGVDHNICILQDFINNVLRRRKRRASNKKEKTKEKKEPEVEEEAEEDEVEVDIDGENPKKKSTTKGVKVYEYYESKRTQTRRPNHRDITKAVFKSSTKTKSGADGKPKHSEHLTIQTSHRKPKPAKEFESSDEADEIDDLADDDFFYEQLNKRRPTTESSDEVESVHDAQPHVNREVVFVHGIQTKQKAKQREKTKDSSEHTELTDDYDDYGEMEMPDADVEMHDTSEQNTKEGHMQHNAGDNKFNLGPGRPPFPQSRPPYIPHPQSKWRILSPVRPIPGPLNPIFANPVYSKPGPLGPPIRPAPPVRPHPNPIHLNPVHPIPPYAKPSLGIAPNKPHPSPPQQPSIQPIPLERPVHTQKFERIEITKKLKSADDLHAEIDKIFETKKQNYDKHGHDKSHWELRIVPLRYKTHEEYRNL